MGQHRQQELVGGDGKLVGAALDVETALHCTNLMFLGGGSNDGRKKRQRRRRRSGSDVEVGVTNVELLAVLT